MNPLCCLLARACQGLFGSFPGSRSLVITLDHVHPSILPLAPDRLNPDSLGYF